MTPPSDLMNKYRNELVDVTTKYRELQEECKKLAIEKADLQHHLAVSSQKASAESKLLDQIYELQKDLDESNKRFLHETSTKEEVEKMLNKSTEQSRILTENLEDLKEQLKSATQNLNEMSGLNNNITCNYNKTKQELEELSSTKTTLQKDLDDMKSRNESLEKTLKECQEQLKNASASAESKFEGQIKELQRDLDESTNRLLHVTSTKEEVEKKLKKSTEHSGTLTKNLKALEGKLKSTTQNLNEMSDSKNNITCKYNEKIQELKELTLSKTTLQKDLDDKKNCLQDMTSRNELLEKRLNELQELHHQLTMANQELERAKKAQCELGNIQSENKVHGKKAVSTVFIHIQSPSDPIQEHDPKKIMPLVMCTLSQYGKIQNDNWDWGQCDRRSLNIFIHFQDSESVNRTVQELNGKVLWEDINSKTVTVQRANGELNVTLRWLNIFQIKFISSQIDLTIFQLRQKRSRSCRPFNKLAKCYVFLLIFRPVTYCSYLALL